MTLDESRQLVGHPVVYRPPGSTMHAHGVVVRVTDRLVFVQYDGEHNAKATDPSLLTVEESDE